jgi:hypothetical protein
MKRVISALVLSVTTVPVVSAFAAGTATPAPTFSTGTGTYYTPPSVRIGDAVNGARIFYTVDGSTPSASSLVYTTPIKITSTTVLRAIAISPAGVKSSVASDTYTFSQPYTPTFSTGTGTYHSAPTVKISEGTACAKVYYTTDGSTPTTSSPVYNGVPLQINQNTTVQAMSQCTEGLKSNLARATYTLATTVAPSFSTGTGTYHAAPTVKISEITSGAQVYYTTDGSTPTSSSPKYTAPLLISTTTTLQAVAIYPGGTPSAVKAATYTVVPAVAPTLNQPSGTYGKSVTVTIVDGTPGSAIYYTTNGATPTGSSQLYSGPITLSNKTSTFMTTQTLKAVAIYPGGTPSAVTAATYSILSEQAPVAGANTGKGFLGMNINALLDGTPWPTVPVGALRLLGAETNWNTMNPSQGVYEWGSLDRKIALAEQNGANLLYAFNETPPWAITQNLPIAQISRNGGVVTLTTAQPHHLYYNPAFQPSEQTSVRISGASDSSLNGTFAITGTPSATTVTYAQGGAESNVAGGSLSAVCGGSQAPKGCAQAPMNLSSWDAYVTEIVNHVGPGVIKYWEVWNEANIASEWLGDPAMLVAMAQDARTIIKRVDPKAIVLSPSVTIVLSSPTECATKDPRCGSRWMDNWLAEGGKNAVDGIAFHGYPQNGTAPELIQGAATMMELALSDNGVSSLPIYDTESSWGKAAALPAQSDQIAFMSRHLILEQSMGVQTSFWYEYDNADWGQMWTASSGLNPVGVAYGEIAKWLQGVSITQPCAATSADNTIFTCGYTRPNGYNGLAVWSTAGEKSFAVPAGMKQYHEVSGAVASAGSGAVQIGPEPILLENHSAF